MCSSDLVSALARVGRFTKMSLLHKPRSCASSFLKFVFLMSSAVHSFHVFLPLPKLCLFPLQLPYLCMLKPSHPHLCASHLACLNHFNLPDMEPGHFFGCPDDSPSAISPNVNPPNVISPNGISLNVITPNVHSSNVSPPTHCHFAECQFAYMLFRRMSNRRMSFHRMG